MAKDRSSRTKSSNRQIFVNESALWHPQNSGTPRRADVESPQCRTKVPQCLATSAKTVLGKVDPANCLSVLSQAHYCTGVDRDRRQLVLKCSASITACAGEATVSHESLLEPTPATPIPLRFLSPTIAKKI